MTPVVCDKAIYTAVFDRPERLYRPPTKPGWETICFTNLTEFQGRSGDWKVVLVERPLEDPRLANRLLKWFPYDYLDAGQYVYCDPHIRFRKHPELLADENCDLSVFRHPTRATIGEEIAACRRRHKITAQQIQAALASLNPELPLYLGGVSWRRPTEAVREFGRRMVEMLGRTEVYRDQIFLPYLLESSPCRCKIHDSRLGLFVHHKHHQWRPLRKDPIHGKKVFRKRKRLR